MQKRTRKNRGTGTRPKPVVPGEAGCAVLGTDGVPITPLAFCEALGNKKNAMIVLGLPEPTTTKKQVKRIGVDALTSMAAVAYAMNPRAEFTASLRGTRSDGASGSISVTMKPEELLSALSDPDTMDSLEVPGVCFCNSNCPPERYVQCLPGGELMFNLLHPVHGEIVFGLVGERCECTYGITGFKSPGVHPTYCHWDHGGKGSWGFFRDSLGEAGSRRNSNPPLLDACVAITGPSCNIGKVVKRAVVFGDGRIFEFLKTRYERAPAKYGATNLVNEFSLPATSDGGRTHFFEEEGVLNEVRAAGIKFSIVELRVGTCYVILRGKPHFFVTVPGVQHSCVSWMTRIDESRLQSQKEVERAAGSCGP